MALEESRARRAGRPRRSMLPDLPACSGLDTMRAAPRDGRCGCSPAPCPTRGSESSDICLTVITATLSTPIPAMR